MWCNVFHIAMINLQIFNFFRAGLNQVLFKAQNTYFYIFQSHYSMNYRLFNQHNITNDVYFSLQVLIYSWAFFIFKYTLNQKTFKSISHPFLNKSFRNPAKSEGYISGSNESLFSFFLLKLILLRSSIHHSARLMHPILIFFQWNVPIKILPLRKQIFIF